VSPQLFQRWDDDLWIIEAKRYVPYYVVDGQQRLTTIIILLQTILERMSDGQALNYSSKEEIRRKFIFESKDGGISRSYLFGYEKDNPSYEFLKTDIFLEKSDTHSTSEQTIYTHNLAYAKRFFSERISALDVASLERVYARVTQHLLFNIYTISEDIDVFVAFETMNNRGKPLSHLELLKNRLIFLSTKFQVDHMEKNKLRTVINECWKAAYHYLGKNQKRPLSDDTFLASHFFVHFGPQLPKNQDDEDDGRSLWKYQHGDHYKDYLLEEVFTSRRLTDRQEPSSPPLSVDSLYAYAQNLKSSVQLYYSLFNPSETSFTDDERINLERLGRLGVDISTSVLLLALYLKEEDGAVRAQALTLLEKLKFLRTISPYIRDLEQMDPIRLGIELATGRATPGDAVKALTDHLDEALQKVRFGSVFANWTKGYGYYGWKGIKYFMFEYEQELLAKSRTNREKLIWDEFIREDFETDYRTVEHIYPQKVVDDCWKKPFARYLVKERNILKNSIGNLVPLSKPKNSSLQNKCFVEKKGSASNKVGYAYGCYSEIEVSQAVDWTPKEILTRGIRLLEFMERRWGFHLGTKQDKIKALGLQFVANRESETSAPHS
jgi:Protein of unknown function DUF262/Protein of unknown function (DUF1524)